MNEYYYREFRINGILKKEYYKVDFNNGTAEFIYRNNGNVYSVGDSHKFLNILKASPDDYIKVSELEFNKILVTYALVE